LDDGIDDTLVSGVGKEIFFALIDFQDYLNSRCESIGRYQGQEKGSL